MTAFVVVNTVFYNNEKLVKFNIPRDHPRVYGILCTRGADVIRALDGFAAGS